MQARYPVLVRAKKYVLCSVIRLTVIKMMRSINEIIHI